MAEALDLDSVTTTKFTLNSGHEMPAVGLGTYRVRNAELVHTTIDHALAAGYRMFDTAAIYHNEKQIGDAFKALLPKHRLNREDIFITAKLSPDHVNVNDDYVRRACQNSLDNLGLDYADLYLLNCPGTPKMPVDSKRNIQMSNASWASLVKLYDDGLFNAIGVSNFSVKQLEVLLKTNHGVIPAVNQVEWHPRNQQKDLKDFCNMQEIVVQAYNSFGGLALGNKEIIAHPGVAHAANKMGVSNAQILLAWALQNDVAVIPKSTDPVHIKSNIKLNFTIPKEEMRILNDLSSFKTKYPWDPSAVP